jgi:2,3-bisphosphoglycerate-independent phosphoglycerate mutase
VPVAPSRPKPVVLLILDGWGHREDPTDNALAQADIPNWRRLWANEPHTLIHTEGRHVGLPDGQMGNSEVGHMNLGAGRIVYQDLTRVDAAIEDGSFFTNAELLASCAAVRASGGTLHVMGLLSPGGVTATKRTSSRCSTSPGRRASNASASTPSSTAATRRRNPRSPA